MLGNVKVLLTKHYILLTFAYL